MEIAHVNPRCEGACDSFDMIMERLKTISDIEEKCRALGQLAREGTFKCARGPAFCPREGTTVCRSRVSRMPEVTDVEQMALIESILSPATIEETSTELSGS